MNCMSEIEELIPKSEYDELEHSLADAMEQISAIQGTNHVYMAQISELQRQLDSWLSATGHKTPSSFCVERDRLLDEAIVDDPVLGSTRGTPERAEDSTYEGRG